MVDLPKLRRRAAHVSPGHRPASVASVATTMSVSTVVRDKIPQQKGALIKLVLLVSIPLVTLVCLAGITLLRASNAIGAATDLKTHIDSTNLLTSLVTALQRERGASCFFLSAADGNMEVNALMEKYRTETGAAVQSVKDHIDIYLGKLEQIDVFRDKIGYSSVTCQTVIDWYTSAIEHFLIEIDSIERSSSSEGLFWATLSDLNLLLKFQDLTGVKRALGGVFYGSCGLDDETMRQFAETRSKCEAFLDRLLFNNPPLQKTHAKQRLQHHQLMRDLETFDREILANNCSHANATKGLRWFDSMTEYMALMSELEKQLSNAVLSSLDGRLETNNRAFWMTLAVVLCIVLVCPPVTLVHGIKSHQLMRRVGRFTHEMSKRNEEIKAEKMRTEQLLCQMLPVSVAKTLLGSGAVEPEKYDQVTVYFSDIKGFTDICSQSSPIQIINFLNELYTKCDQILDLYDCYKVETIGDAYMVVSGLPERNGIKHSEEICTMALEISMNMREFAVPHMPTDKIAMRIGIHTGPCAAGVVGLKMPRYCLFGDTVNMASRMESNSLAGRIQISEATFDHLANNHNTFECVSRGSIAVKGKGVLKTFWLVGKENFSFRITLPNEQISMVEELGADGSTTHRESTVTLGSSISARFDKQ